MQPDMQPNNLHFPFEVVVAGRRRVVDGLVGYTPVGCNPVDCNPVDCTLAGCTLVGCSIQDAAAAGNTAAAAVEVGIHAPEFCSDDLTKEGGWRDGSTGSFRRRFRHSNR